MRTSRILAFSASSLAVLLSVQPSVAGCVSTLIPTPSVDNFNYITGEYGTSLADIWAVGYSQTDFGNLQEKTLIEHFDGTDWSVVPSPNDKDHPGNTLLSVSASTPTDAWAVGFDNDANGQPRTLAMHWNGSSWKQVQTHFWGSCYQWRTFTGVSANPANARDVWAVGWALYGCLPQTDIGFAEHWNGRSWSLVKIFDKDVTLRAVSWTAQGAWAVGSNYMGRGSHPFIVHIDGSVVTQWPAPDSCCVLTSVSATGPNDVWAIGAGGRSKNFRPIIEHFDGTKWTSIANPRTAGDLSLYSVYAVSPTDVWAVGAQGVSNGSGGWLNFAGHWNGSAWSIVPFSNVALYEYLTGVYGTADRILAVGESGYVTRRTLGAIASCATGELR